MTGAHPNHRARESLPVELRRTGVPPTARAWIERQTGRSVVGCRRLAGASSSAVHAIALSDGDAVVLRRWCWPGIFVDEPVVAQREIDALTAVAGLGLPAPELIAADPSGDSVGDGVPLLLMSKCAGQARRDPDLRLLAQTLSQIHDCHLPDFPHEFFRWCTDALDGPPPLARDKGLWRKALRLRAEGMPDWTPLFIHRDYHPGNVLWSRGQITGIVDWALACRGPWECDVATCRSNLIDLQGLDAADEFLARYTSLTGRRFHPYWDLNYLLEAEVDHWDADNVADAEAFMHDIFVRWDS